MTFQPKWSALGVATPADASSDSSKQALFANVTVTITLWQSWEVDEISPANLSLVLFALFDGTLSLGNICYSAA